MPLHIDRVETEIDVRSGERREATETGSGGTAARPVPEDRLTIERLRPLVLRILEEELARFSRRVG
jgi:hypothetical protein